jgi:hypothetical protein
MHPHLAPKTLDNANEIRFAVARCHEVDDPDVSGSSFKIGFKNQRV